ncbi:MAG TPA: bifunctional methylenetetrahydrofolate dehydrogenase/methenyltetrahydrofolate cyclohydrolase FolD [Syntrophales bacterium]|nr:bifunctional methylenetetrahydrofolate dehydrogenase/methenyltetrahydrofolate cyclohydrolase FolD [Syntrophales bacterium]
MAVIIDGKKIAQNIRHEVKAETLRLKEQMGVTPGLAVILVGNDPASQIYVRRKENACKEVGFLSREYRLPQDSEEAQVLRIIHELNQDSSIHGILVQLPLPKHLSAVAIVEKIDPRKDVDGLHPWNTGRLFTGNPYHIACTPRGIVEMIDQCGIEIEGKDAVIIGRSNLVGKPLALLLLNRHATVTICHTRTRHLAEVTKRAEILIAAAGRPEMITGDMVGNGAVVIDVGINRINDGRLVGDVAFAEVAEKASYITPVPGGVGLMTVAMLLANTLNAARDLSAGVQK